MTGEGLCTGWRDKECGTVKDEVNGCAEHWEEEEGRERKEFLQRWKEFKLMEHQVSKHEELEWR